MHVWKKIVRPDRAEFWTDGLVTRGGVSPERLVVVQPAAGSPYGLNHAAGFAEDVIGSSVRLEIYCERAAEARRLVRDFGGQARALRPGEWERWLASSAIDRPLRIGRRLLVSNQLEELARLRAENEPAGRHVLCIPAAMAFGTGEHATTAMCLRLLDAILRERRNAAPPWDLLDLGTGSGILALAALKLGARHALGLDTDPTAVRTARENAQLNEVSPRRVRFAQADLLDWKTDRPWPVIAANLFSDLLIRLLPGVIAPALAPGGDLVLSGVLASQAKEVATAVRRAGLKLGETKRRGRWCAFRARKAVVAKNGWLELEVGRLNSD